MGKIIDLHIHTNLSDGELSPKEVVDLAFSNGVSVIAIADHDTVDAYNDEFYDYVKSKGIDVINAVEISTVNNSIGIHILGYNIDISNQELKQKLSTLKNARHNYLHAVLSRLEELDYVTEIEELEKIEVVTKAHIANNIISNPSNHDLLLKNFKHIPNKGEFIETIMNEGCIAYVKKESMTSKEAADLIRKAGGKVIVAHPVAYKYEDDLSLSDILDLVNEIKADGIESNYIYIDRNNNKINEIDEWNKIAKEKNLIATIGSDFHMLDGIHPEIGLIEESINITESDLNEILDNLS